jgi:AcrR family transcriptional regulator
VPIRTAQTQNRRSEILAASLACFAEHGVDGTTIEMICRHSGASVGSLYHHFGDKEGIATALAAEGVAAYQRGLLDILGGESRPGDAVPAMVHHHLSWISDYTDWARYLFTQLRGSPVDTGAVKAANRHLFAQLSGWISSQSDQGRLIPMPPAVFLAVVLGPAQEISRRWLVHQQDFELEEVAEVLAVAAQRATGAAN